MYNWLWSHLPGNFFVRIIISMMAFAVVVVLLFLIIFPALEPILPIGDVTVEVDSKN